MTHKNFNRMSLNKRLYNLYIQTYDWNARKREYINSLTSHLCELCQINKWEDVHHQNYDSLDYDNPGRELDEHLLYVCKECHHMLHTLATWEHSTRQEDMDEWLALLKEINDTKRIEHEENKRLQRLADESRRKKEKEEHEKMEAERILFKEKKKRESEEVERLKKEEAQTRMKENERGNIFMIAYTIWYFIFFKAYVFPLFKEFDTIVIFAFIFLWWLCAIPFLPFALLLGYFHNKNTPNR